MNAVAHVRMGKKSPRTLAHFGWGSQGETLDDAVLPAAWVDDWRTLDEILESIATHGNGVQRTLATLRSFLDEGVDA